MNKAAILVVGGAGFIGSHVNQQLRLAGYPTVVLDNLANGDRKAVMDGHFIQGDLGDAVTIKKILKEFNIQVVMHFAAFIDVGESVIHPLKYYENNFSQTLQLLKTLIENDIKKFIFSSSAAIFGIPTEIPLKENHSTYPINPYGRTKLMIEHLLQDLDVAYNLKSCCLRYFNAAGGDPEKKLKNFKKQESNLIPIALRSLKQPQGSLTIYGTDYPTKDGTCVRDYIHIMDLASAHISAMQQLLEGKSSSQYNLGNGMGFTVKEILQAVEQITSKPLNIKEGKRRVGDPPILIADSQKARKELNWQPQYPDLKTIIQHAWDALN